MQRCRPRNAALLDIASLADGRIAPSLDPQTVKMLTVQQAIWVVTKGPRIPERDPRGLLVDMLATAPDDIEAQASIFERFLATVPP